MTHIVDAIGNVSWLHFISRPEDKDIYLIDVRTPSEWRVDGVADIKNIKLISYMFFEPSTELNPNFISELISTFPDKNLNLFFICKSGQRSLKAAEAALSAGFKNVYNISGGYSYNDIARKQCH